MFKKKKLDLHPKPKQTIQVNRPLIMAISAVVVTVILLAVVAAFTTTKKVKTDTVETKVKTDKASVVSPILEGLPKDYSDIGAIKKYLPESENGRLTSLNRRLNDLQKAYLMLERQLSAKEDTGPRKPPINPQTKQAIGSDLSFSGIDSGMDSLIGGKGTSKSRLSKTKDDGLIATKEQEELIRYENENARKLAVFKGKDKVSDIYDMHNVIKPISRYQVMAGTLIPATLITGIDTTHVGPAIAQVRSNIYDITGKHVLIPKGSKLLGAYRGGGRIRTGMKRVSLGFNRLVRPNGTSILLGGYLGVDATGKAGIEGDVNNHWARIIGASTISTILNIGAGIASDNTASNNLYPNSKQKAMSGAASGINDVGQQIVRKNLNIPPTISLPPGHQFHVTVKKDMVFNGPYKPRR